MGGAGHDPLGLFLPARAPRDHHVHAVARLDQHRRFLEPDGAREAVHQAVQDALQLQRLRERERELEAFALAQPAGHGVERVRQLAQLVVAPHVDVRLQRASRHGLRGVAELPDRRRDGPDGGETEQHRGEKSEREPEIRVPRQVAERAQGLVG